jgi:hypothetical protein
LNQTKSGKKRIFPVDRGGEFSEVLFAESDLGPEDMISQLRPVKVVPWSRSTKSMSTPFDNSDPSTNHLLACRLVQMILALYLIPAVLIVFLVGILGIIIVTVVRILARLQGRTMS